MEITVSSSPSDGTGSDADGVMGGFDDEERGKVLAAFGMERTRRVLVLPRTTIAWEMDRACNGFLILDTWNKQRYNGKIRK